ncbi:hypothetical protein LPJ66_004005 [Kickxella alabastrina]|uniref:Uncharacterized protein n=1 Tax=Kickxella alabastrina TaxID=61397 RepID=A0ACC1IIH8_9FUNG|nr:hypothetical protein LPJ66_004005 [Kickxella alabastrina]
MGIRDEAHIPDKYYCEKCRPEDHPYINSRPRTVVLAEASALGASTMMRRSAVMAVAKMTAREEYRSASAAATIAASVAAAATGTKPANGKRTPKKPAKKTEDTAAAAAAAGTSPTPKSARKGRRARRSTRGGADNDGPENSEEDYEDSGKQKDGSRTSSSPSGNANGTEDGSPTGSKCANSGSRKTQQTPRRSANPANGSRKRRRTTGRQSTGSTHEQGALESAEGEGEGDEGSDSDTDSGAAEDLVARMMGVKQEPKGKAKSRLPKSRTRSVSTIVKGSVNRSSAELTQDGLGLASALGSPRGRIGGGGGSSSRLDFQMDANEARRGHSVPGSPRQLSPSPSLQSLLYSSVAAAIADGKFDAGGSSKADKLCKRKRASGSVRNAKRQRMTVSATNSPYIGDGGGFATFGGSNLSFQQQRSKDAKSAAVAAAAAAVAADKAGGDQDDEEEEEESHSTADDKVEGHGGNQRQPKHNFPPQEMMDVDGNIILVSSHMLNSQGKPIYSSISPETMCKIRYPHSKASIYELNRRAKQLLEWLGKTQSEYEHERMSWLLPSPVLTAAAAAEVAIEGEEAHETLGCAPVAGRQYSQQLSEAPTSPINPNDWPNDDTADDCEIVFKDRGASCFDELVGSQRRQQQPAALEKAHPRDTRSIMEGLMSRLIQFQEMYSS